ncbi:MAG: hypothetical protein VYA60_07790 [Pseudomonadota bacterium]|nr:hypothetical protein [Pseudomonadota bacterium]
MNAAVIGWIEWCQFYKKDLDKNIDDYEPKTVEVDLEGIDNKTVIELLTQYPDAKFVDNALVYKRRMTVAEHEQIIKNAERGLKAWTNKINNVVGNNSKMREETLAYLERHNIEIEGLKL